MLILTDLSYQNFLASGNAPIKLDLDKNASTLIVGRNGAGKSTMSEAICFALFGRSLRNITKPRLINSVNQRDCLVELGFKVREKTYKVRRGIKPNIFEIYENGTLIEPPADLKDYQTVLEENILNLNYKSFMQVVVLGNASYTPFMRLTTAARRAIIEDLLDIEVFSSMNTLTKDELSTLKGNIDRVVQAKTLIAEQKRMATAFTAVIEDNRAAEIAALETKLAQQEADIEEKKAEYVALKEANATYDEVRTLAKELTDKKLNLDRTWQRVKDARKDIAKELAFYMGHDTCPTCEQPIDATFKAKRIGTLKTKDAAGEAAEHKCATNISKVAGEQSAVNDELKEATSIQRDMAAIESTLPVLIRYVKQTRDEIERVRNRVVVAPEKVDVAELDAKLEALEKDHARLTEERIVVEAAMLLLKDNGIKARVIKHYLPIINRTINHYLNAMDFPILFTLNEEFSETIKSRHRDDFSYESFSEGERKRIDLALLLTWRAVARLKNSASTNILILDEVFDGSLDAAGTEEFLKIIAELEKDTSVFVISHKTDQLVDKFTNTIVFDKTKGFSTIVS